ncbi:serine hydrolase domain-containing protein [Hyphococcus luteus]|uniref:Beta-lactamase-related domain-containing protein n=1 Tax=Hyphococcus luteus TaxID=2058213 RepID=A0A2S7K2J3_9PROT|nr:serine hydrolase domain-containing protein [Marinicaulis flavus]PQA86719.1 hypothetical protein CW354_14610 [Marinicaulis flavus]
MKRQMTGLLGALALTGVLALGGCSQETAGAAPYPAEPGETISVSHLDHIDAVLQSEVDEGLRAGFVAAVMTRDGVVYKKAFGKAGPVDDVPMTTDTRFRIASMTKPIVSVAVMQLVDRGVIRLNDPVSRFIPAYADPQVVTDQNRNEDGEFDTRPASREITIHDLLTHQAGVGYVFANTSDLDKAYLDANLLVTEGTLEERIDRIAALPLYNDPGTVWSYSFSVDILGRVIEAASGMGLEAYLKENIFDPLGMNATEFFIDESDFEGVAVVAEFNEAGEMYRSDAAGLSSPVNDQAFGVASGGAGLVSNIDDYSRFMRMLLNGGALDGARILAPATVRLMMQDHTKLEARPAPWGEGMTFGLGGYVMLKPGYMGSYAAKGEWGWGGYWDTHFFVNVEDNVGAVLMAQTQPGPHMPPSRAEDIVKAVAYSALRK